MNADDYLRIYVALRTAHPRAAIAAIATLQLAMINELGEEEQRALVTRGNAREVPTEHRIPHAVHRGYCENLFRRAGMTDAELNSTSHVLQHFARTSRRSVAETRRSLGEVPSADGS